LLSLRSKVEVGPTGARHYDLFMDVISLGYYHYLIKKVIDKMDIKPGHSILDLGSGTGRNDCFIARKIGPDGGILGLDMSKEMLRLSRKRCQSYPNAKFKEQ
jgi:ubiquinone/menaquinone biosynthesis C-methylase UbiE